jgi:hypothetical protein
MMKLEGPTGLTIDLHLAQSGTAPCDPAFGAVPNQTDSSTDYGFPATVTFPGEW